MGESRKRRIIAFAQIVSKQNDVQIAQVMRIGSTKKKVAYS